MNTLTHEQKVARVIAEVRARAAQSRAGGEHISLGKAAVSHFVPNPHDPRHRDHKLDVRDLNQLIAIDVAGRTCTAEPGLTFADLVRATLPHGLIPKLVSELETITIGGAVADCAIESMSYKHGGFHDSCWSLEIVTGTGERLHCSREEPRPLRHDARLLRHLEHPHAADLRAHPSEALGAHGVSAPPELRSLHARSAGAVRGPGRRLCRCHRTLPRSDGGSASAVSSTATTTPRPPAPTEAAKSSTGARCSGRRTTSPLFRYDTDCHWASRAIPGMGSRLGRRLFGKLFLGSTRMLGWSRRLRPILKHQKHLPVVIDLMIPKRRFAEFYRWYEEVVGYYSLWIVPYRMPTPYPWVTEAHRSDLYIDVAVYGLPNDDPRVNFSKLLEDRTFALGGVKTLISENHHDPATFWKIYDRDAYEQVKRRTDPLNLFRTVYQKFHFKNPHAIETAPVAAAAKAVA